MRTRHSLREVHQEGVGERHSLDHTHQVLQPLLAVVRIGLALYLVEVGIGLFAGSSQVDCWQRMGHLLVAWLQHSRED